MANTGSYTPQQASAAGLGWVPQNNPNYGQKGFIGYGDTPASSTPSSMGVDTGVFNPQPSGNAGVNPAASGYQTAAPGTVLGWGRTSEGDPIAPTSGGSAPFSSTGVRSDQIPGTASTAAATPPVPSTPKPAAPPGINMVPTQDGKGWVPDNSPLAWKPPAGGSAPASSGTPPAAASPAPTSSTPSSGQQPPVPPIPKPAAPPGVTMVPTQDGKGWVPDNSPIAWKPSGGAGAAPPAGSPSEPGGGTPPAGGAPPAGTTPASGTPAPGSTPGITNSPTPDAPTSPTTGNQGMQDTLRNALISQMTQNPIPSINDPSIQAQLQPFAAAAQRGAESEISQGAEGAFANQQDFGQPEKLAAEERAGQATGQEASSLIGDQMKQRQQEIENALSGAEGVLSNDQKNALTEELAKIQDATARAGLAQAGQLGNRELDIREELGKLGISAEQIDAMMRDQEFMASLGLQAGTTAANLNAGAASAAGA